MKKKNGLYLCGLGVIGGAIIYATVPSAQKIIKDIAPFAILLLCPLMMLFGMHGSHGKEGTRDDTDTSGKPPCH